MFELKHFEEANLYFCVAYIFLYWVLCETR